MLPQLNIIANKLLFFAEIGEKYAVNEQEFPEIWKLLQRKKKRYKYDKIQGGYLIWRTK